MTIEKIQNEIVDEFDMFEDWMQRYEYMIELGKSLPLIDDQYKTDDHLIKGCQSKVWLHADLEDGKVKFTADSDAIRYRQQGADGLLTAFGRNQRGAAAIPPQQP